MANGNPLITAVEVFAISGPAPPPGGRPLQTQVRPLHIYAEHRAPHPGGPPAGSLRRLYLRIGTDEGVEGIYGPIDREAALGVVGQLTEFLIGADALAGSIIWDKMARLDRHSRHGHFKMAMSAVDNALWDLRGKFFHAPVYRLLGGPARERVPVYASTLGTAHDSETVSSFPVELNRQGFRHQKWFLAHGPGSGADGLAGNLDLVGRLRDAVGTSTDLMVDAFMGWDLRYALEFTRRAEPFGIAWLEEPFPPSQYPAFKELRRSSRIPLSAGEHLYDRAEVLPYLTDGVITVLQADPEWCGGVTELTRLCSLAESFGVHVIPHGHGMHAALHVVASQSPGVCPMAEYLLHMMPVRHHFERRPLTPVDGHITLPTAPGFGIEFDDAKIESRTIWPASP